MFTSIQSFVAQWKNESTATARILDALTDASLSQEVGPNHRTLGRLAWHITSTIHEMISLTGLKFDAVGDEHKVPESAADIADTYRQTGQALVDAIQNQWTDENLLETSNMYGEQWANGLTLHLLISHEIHHRGQMTVLMRQAGLRVPGIYGPALEEWLERGATPPAV